MPEMHAETAKTSSLNHSTRKYILCGVDMTREGSLFEHDPVNRDEFRELREGAGVLTAHNYMPIQRKGEQGRNSTQ